MISSDELYGELWAADESPIDVELARSLEPRGTTDLYEAFAQLGVGPDDIILDAGARDAVHAIEIVLESPARVVEDVHPSEEQDARPPTPSPTWHVMQVKFSPWRA